MNYEELKYRFEEIVTAVDLLPDDPDLIDEMPVLPNLTRDIAERELYTAILCQSLKGDESFRIRMCAILHSSAHKSIQQAIDNDGKPSEDDLYALSVSANLMWASGAQELLQTMGMIGQLCSVFDLEVPDLATIIFRSNQRADKFGVLDPYKILEGGYTTQDVLEATQE